MRSLALAAVVAVSVSLLAACGGSSAPRVTASSQPVTVTSSAPPFESVSVSIRSESGNPSGPETISYLRQHASGGPWYAGPSYTWQQSPGLVRFAQLPTVRIAEGTDPHLRAMTSYAVALINRVLPYERHIRIGEDAPALAAIGNVPDGQVFVDFGPSETWNDPNQGRPGASAGAQIDHGQEWDARQKRWEKRSMRAGHVWMDWNSPELRLGESEKLAVLVHELFHTLGLHGHVPTGEFPDSIMRDMYLLISNGGVPAIDGAGLRALYMNLGEATDPEELSLESLGPWERNSTTLMGTLQISQTGSSDDELSFGVRHRNGITVPWTRSGWPDTALSDNRALQLQGSATWKGGLLGFMPDARLVGGNARIDVSLANMDGSAQFYDLQILPAGQGAGAFGSGVRWNTGSLDYDISVSGNVMHRTGGDEGNLSGRFYGNSHEGAAGTLERSDLTAAFGASR